MARKKHNEPETLDYAASELAALAAQSSLDDGEEDGEGGSFFSLGEDETPLSQADELETVTSSGTGTPEQIVYDEEDDDLPPSPPKQSLKKVERKPRAKKAKGKAESTQEETIESKEDQSPKASARTRKVAPGPESRPVLDPVVTTQKTPVWPGSYVLGYAQRSKDWIREPGLFVRSCDVFSVQPYKVSPAERAAKSQEMSELMHKKMQKADEAKLVAAQFKSELQELEGQIQALCGVVRTGHEMREVSCFEVVDFNRNVKLVVRRDNESIVGSHTVNASEREAYLRERDRDAQQSLFAVAQAHKEAIEAEADRKPSVSINMNFNGPAPTPLIETDS